MVQKGHQSGVAEQFGANASAYLSSATHAMGADLQALAERLAARPVGRVLDLGCGAGHASYACAGGAERVVAYDLSARMLAIVQSEASARGLHQIITRQGSVERLPFDDASFDMVVSRYSAHHWPGLAAGLGEAARVLKPGGAAVWIDVIGPTDPVLDSHLQAIELLRDPSHARDYSVPEWRQALRAAGFSVIAERRWRLALDFAAWVGRSQTSALRQEALRQVFADAPSEVRSYLQLTGEGDFSIDAGSFDTVRAGGAGTLSP